MASVTDSTAAVRTARLTALSDGVFAIAMTLLVLDIAVPPDLDDAGFHRALRDQLPNLGAYALSFLVLSQFWRDHRYVLARVDVSATNASHLALIGLGLVALLPFPTALLAEYGSAQPLATAAYATGIAAVNGVHLALLLGCETKDAPADAVQRLTVIDLALSTAVFAVSVPLAFVNPAIGMLSWTALIPAKAIVSARQRRAEREEGAVPIG